MPGESAPPGFRAGNTRATADHVPPVADAVPVLADHVPAVDVPAVDVPAVDVPAVADHVLVTTGAALVAADDVPAIADDVPAAADDVLVMTDNVLVTSDDVPATADHVLATAELRRSKPNRRSFTARSRLPLTLVLDGVRGNYNLGAIFRLCDAFLVERLVICGVPVMLRKRKLVRAAAGAQRWVPWQEAPDAAAVVREAKAAGAWIAVVELTAGSVAPADLQPRFPAVLVLGGEATGVSAAVLACADQAVAIPMLGMSNSLNVATAGAIVLHELVRRYG